MNATPSTMTKEELAQLGEARYGQNVWKARLARELDVNERTVRRWSTGETPIPGPMAKLIRMLCEQPA